uniref:VWA domain-containing protein n=1 Tax=candidate division WOR-3 bacterium TaxID=2052148 RepID=A0A7C4THZ6_UNCW3
MIPFLISILAIFLAFFLYYKKLARFFLRLIPIVIFLLLISGFSYNFKVKGKTGPPVMLIDVSPSMKSYIHNVMEEVKNVKYEHSKVFFSESTAINPAAAGGRFTDITRAILEAKEFNPSAILLISDGNHNFGSLPQNIIADLKIQVFTFGVGMESMRDQRIVDVLFPDYIFKDDTVRIEVVVESKGFEGGNGIVCLKSLNSNLEIQKKYPLSKFVAQNYLEFKIPAISVGNLPIDVFIEHQPEEIDYENNEMKFSLNVLERKISVLYYTDHPSFNTKFILHSLKNNEWINLQATAHFLADKFLDILNNRIINPFDFSKFDVLVLDNIDGANPIFSKIGQFVKNGGGVLFLGSIENINENLREILPIVITEKRMDGEFYIKVQKRFSVLSPEDSFLPVSSINRVLVTKSDCRTIATAENLPVIGYINYGAGRVFQINIIDIGIWQFASLNLINKDFLSVLLDDILKFVSPLGKKERLILKTQRRQYQFGEEVNFKLASYNEDFTLTSGGDFYLVFGKEKIPFFEWAPGLYEAKYTPKSIGDFEVFAMGTLGDESLRSSSIKIKVIGLIEKEKEINKFLLQEIAEKTSGRYFPLSEIGRFQPPEGVVYYETKKISFDSVYFYLLIFGCFVLDWILRRKEGLV